MLEYVSVFSKGGAVLWKYNPSGNDFLGCINMLIQCVVLEGKSTDYKCFEYYNLAVNCKVDNDLQLVYAAVFQKAINLPYMDILLNQLQFIFKEKFENKLKSMQILMAKYDFDKDFNVALLDIEESFGIKNKTTRRRMRTFNESLKSQKTVASMIDGSMTNETKKANIQPLYDQQSLDNDNLVYLNRKKLKEKLSVKKSAAEYKRRMVEQDKVGKKPRVWELEGSAKDAVVLNRSKHQRNEIQYQIIQKDIVGTMQGCVTDLVLEAEDNNASRNKSKRKTGIFSYFNGVVGSKELTISDIKSSLDKMHDHLIFKNVAAGIARKLCESVATDLIGKSVGSLESVASLVKTSLTSSLLKILSPRRRIDIIRDAQESRNSGEPYIIIFCGVNGVGKSTNLAKICFWLVENNFSVLIAACDTFRAGAIEQLRTHTRHINVLHPPENHNRTMVQLYEKGYGKDAASIALEAIKYAKEITIDIVLIDTAGRMQDNEPLMRSLSKLIKVNNPNLVLFVGEALVGNEAVDQLIKFNQCLADFSSNENPHIIDGIVLTKFDTIDDKVGAAISMTYVTGQPIVFVGTGQTYTDLKVLNVNNIVQSLIK